MMMKAWCDSLQTGAKDWDADGNPEGVPLKTTSEWYLNGQKRPSTRSPDSSSFPE